MATDGPTTMGGERIERRRPKPPGRLPIETLREMPAMVVLERLPAPAVAVDRPGTILFANTAFCDMVGYSSHDELPTNFDEIFRSLPAGDRWIALVGTGGPRLVELLHREGHAVWASMSKSAMRRRDDTVALVSFHDLTEELWLCSKAFELPHEALARTLRGIARRGGWS